MTLIRAKNCIREPLGRSNSFISPLHLTAGSVSQIWGLTNNLHWFRRVTWSWVKQASQACKVSFFAQVLANIGGLVIFFSRRHSCKFGKDISLISQIVFNWYVIKICTIPWFVDILSLNRKYLQKEFRSAILILRNEVWQ